MASTERMTEEVCKIIKTSLDNLDTGLMTVKEFLTEIQRKNKFTNEDMEEFLAWLECDAMNEYEEGFLKGYDCKKCNNRGYMNTYERVNGKLYYPIAVDCECKRIRAMYTQLEQCGIHKKQIDKYTLDNYSTKELWQNTAKNTALKYLEASKQNKEFDEWLIIHGVSGAGKSHLATAVFIELIKQGKKGKFMMWKDDGERLLKLKKSFDTSQYEKEILPYKLAEVLYIDDLFKLMPDGADKTNMLDIAYTIINARYSNHLPTIISTEEELYDIEMLDSAIYGRIVEMSKNYDIKLNYDLTKDMRRR